eukprot:755432-Hanusia_phi.AAC.2
MSCPGLDRVVVPHDASKTRAPACTRCRSKKLKSAPPPFLHHANNKCRCEEVRPCSSCVKRGFALECSNEMPDCLPESQRRGDGIVVEGVADNSRVRDRL